MRKHSFWIHVMLAAVLLAGAAPWRAQAAPTPQTWAPPINVSNSPTIPSTHPSMAVDQTGTLHLVWVEGAPPATQIRYAARPNNQAWSGPIAISETPRADNPRVVVDNQSTVHVVWQADGNSNKADIYYRQIRNNLPSPIQQITNNASETTFPDVAVDVFGGLHFVFLDNGGGANQVFYIFKRLADAPPPPITVGSTPTLDALQPRAVADSQGTVSVVWAQPPLAGQQNDIFYAYRPVNQPTFSPTPPINASSTTTNSTAPVLAIDSADNLHLAWLEMIGQQFDVYYSRKNLAEFVWRSPLNVSNSPSWNTATPDMVVDFNRTVYVVFSEDLGGGNTDIFYSDKSDTAPQFSIPQPVATNTTPSTWPSVAVQGTVAVHVAWQDGPTPPEILYSQYLLPQPAPSTLLLQQVEADSPTAGDNTLYQWVQLFNNGPADVSLDGWQICSNQGCTPIPRYNGSIITLKSPLANPGQPAQSIIVTANADRFRQEHPGFQGLLLSVGGLLANGMNITFDTLQLRSPQGGVVDQVTWGSSGVTPPPPRTRDTLQRNLLSNSWYIAQEVPVSTAAAGPAGAAGNVLYVPIALKAYQSWDSGIQVQNLSSQPATFNVTYYTQQGTVAYAEPVQTVSVGASKTYFLPASVGLAGNFFGSAVVTSTGAIAGIVNLTNYSYIGNKSATTSYNAVDRPNPTVGLPYVRREAGFATQFVVQNTTGQLTTYRVAYYDQSGVLVNSADGSLPALGSALVDTDQTLASRTGIHSAVVTSPVPVAVSVLGLDRTASMAISYRGASGTYSAGTAAPAPPPPPPAPGVAPAPVPVPLPSFGTGGLYAPLLFKNRNNYNSFLNIQNLGTAPATITISYITDQGQALTGANESVVVQPNGLYRSSMATRAGIPDGWVGSATISSSTGQPLIAVAEQVNPVLNQATSYNAVESGEASTTLYAPLLMKANNGWDTGLQVQNVGTAPATVTVTYYSRDTFAQVGQQTQVIQPNAPYTFFTPQAPNLPPTWVGSAVIQSVSTVPLVGVVNQVNYVIGNGGDTSMSYSLVVQPAAG